MLRFRVKEGTARDRSEVAWREEAGAVAGPSGATDSASPRRTSVAIADLRAARSSSEASVSSRSVVASPPPDKPALSAWLCR